jgi:zinc-binding alcohol dehydrogenase/oxidoreductase
MVNFMTTHNIIPVIDEIIPLADAEKATRKMDHSSQFGKIVLQA